VLCTVRKIIGAKTLPVNWNNIFRLILGCTLATMKKHCRDTESARLTYSFAVAVGLDTADVCKLEEACLRLNSFNSSLTDEIYTDISFSLLRIICQIAPKE